MLSPNFVHLNTADVRIVADVCQEFLVSQAAPSTPDAVPAPRVEALAAAVAAGLLLDQVSCHRAQTSDTCWCTSCTHGSSNATRGDPLGRVHGLAVARNYDPAFMA